MILLDTNIVSATMAPTPPASVIAWLNGQDTLDLYLSTVTIAEIGYGLWVLHEGKRRRDLEDRFAKFVAAGFEHRILSFDEQAAHLYAEVMCHRRTLGRPLGVLDGQIASIAQANNMAVATRNVCDFEECGLDVLNPFDDQPA
jgi:predicted nucleic acid-binding protein